MDYSATINEADDPAASPWATSPSLSPQKARAGFAAIAGEAPHSPFPYNPQAASLEHAASQPDLSRPGTASTESGTQVSNVDHGSAQGASVAESADASHLGAQEPSDVHEQTGPSHKQTPQARQQQPTPQPRSQFKLQAKITGLERTGKKDPVLRFDVHVGLAQTRVSLFCCRHRR
ncbi:hypothetical protein E4U42_005588 [Claviceps africana]|uniref:Uncharacterized protein n=1 Tax=Claviceps africana TaxID=83212 RepID=A0A8K0J436_9HYPO|nr:hypothetical protein E4U42_005588 [Claviceps africana]